MEKKTLATVGGFAITTDDVDEFLVSLGQRAQSYNTPEGRAIILKQLKKKFVNVCRRDRLTAYGC